MNHLVWKLTNPQIVEVTTGTNLCRYDQRSDWRMNLTSDTLNVGKERIVQVFEYLKALNEHRNPAKRQIREQPWALWYSDLPDHPAIMLGAGLQKPDESDDESAR